MSVGEQLGLDDPNDRPAGPGACSAGTCGLTGTRNWEPLLGRSRFENGCATRTRMPGTRSFPPWVLWARATARTTAQPPARSLWLLLPGASLLARRLRGFSPIIDELVAAQLWVEARTLPATTTQRVAAIILRNTLREVLLELGRLPARDKTVGAVRRARTVFPAAAGVPGAQ